VSAPPLFSPAPVAVQRITEKHIKNVFTLGLRIPYVKYRRAHRPAIPLPTATPVEKYAEAYEKARHYHTTNTRAMEAKGGIREAGLLIDKGASGLTNASGFSNDPAYNRRTVHVTDARNRGYYSQGVKIRPFLPADRVKLEKEWWDPAMRVERQDRDELRHLYRDKEDPELGTWITGADIPPEAIHFGQTEDLADVRSDTIFQVIASHWDGTPPNTDDLRELHRQAVRERRLSLALEGEV
jgi:hypothetical protein